MNQMTKPNVFFVDDEQILEYSRLDNESKLRWLENARILINVAFTEEEKKLRKLLFMDETSSEKL